MSWLADKLRTSRTAAALGAIEKGEAVDWQRWSTAQPLELVHAGELFAADLIEREEQADAEFEQFCNDLLE